MASAHSEENAPGTLTLITFRALVEALVPVTPALAIHGAEQAIGAAQTGIHEYLAWELDHSLSLSLGLGATVVPMAAPTAALLNCAAAQLILSGQVQAQDVSAEAGRRAPFAALTPEGRILTLSKLERLEVDLGALPPPYRDDGGWIRFMVDYLNRAVLFGFYSEWSAYGSTRLETPVLRRLECWPIGWRQVGYPGVSLGYRALRGQLLTIVREGGTSDIV